MKSASMFLFVVVAMSVYLAGNYYVYIHGWHALPDKTWIKISYIALAAFISLSFLLGKMLERTSLQGLNAVFTWVGSFSWSVLLYFFIIVLLVDAARLMNHLFSLPWLNAVFGIPGIARHTLTVSVLLVAMLNIAGYLVAASPVEIRLNIFLDKKSTVKKIRIAMASDIHLGTLVGKRKLDRLVGSINRFKPDAVLLAGDILDENHAPIFRKDIGAPLRNIVAPLGVYAVTGNHEYIGGIKDAAGYIESLNIKMVRDTVLLIGDLFYLAGREDFSSHRLSGGRRKELGEICAGIDFSRPVILMDHEPYKLEEAEKAGIDLQLSGHTHHGQFWPINYITSAIFEVSRGYKKKGNTHVYVSTGYGTWGPPVRLGNRPEVVLIEISFAQ